MNRRDGDEQGARLCERNAQDLERQGHPDGPDGDDEADAPAVVEARRPR